MSATLIENDCTAHTTIRSKIKWVDLAKAKKTIALPHPWPTMESHDFHQDLTDRAYAHLAYCVHYCDSDAVANAQIVLEAMGNGFIVSFDRSRFEPGQNDPNRELKTGVLDALDGLAKFYGNRVSAVIWESFACLACRENPEEERSIIKEGSAGTLPYHYTIVDAALHAAGLVYTFVLHVNSAIFAKTGRVLVHNCDCNHSLVNVEKIGGRVDYALPRANINTASQSVFTHFLAETVKLNEDFLPFAYSITPEARDIQMLLQK